jgi:plastocyanin
MLVVFAASSVVLYAGAKVIEPAPSAEETVGGNGPAPTESTIKAVNLKFDKRTILAAAGSSYKITLDNQDAGVLHNIAFYTNNRATQEIYKGELFPGVATRTFTFSVPPTPGNFYFRCDVHPDTMNGTFTVQ